MRILIWQEYGGIGIHCAETVEQLVSLYGRMKGIVASWQSKADASEYDAELHEILYCNEATSLKRDKIEDLMERFFDDECRHNESFEEFVFSRVKYP